MKKETKVDLAEKPVQKCGKCGGKGEVYSRTTFWVTTVYRTCPKCNGSGKPNEITYCFKCLEMLTDASFYQVCVNRHCDNFGLLTVGSIKKPQSNN